MGTKIKLCGLTREEDAAAAAELMPDYVGFVMAPRSRRYVAPEQAARLRRLLPAQIQAVGVFVDEEPETVAGLLERGIIDLAQLHGREDRAYVKRLLELTDRPLIQAFQVRDSRDVEAAMDSPAHYILLDAGPGGTGNAFDWSLIRDVERPYFLAGGLHPGNVAAGIARLRPYGVDVSSGIETEGRKDPEKMAAFVAAVRSAKEL
ncbi:MAG TPA: phosphoribosylanthranilate isomerase [Candidatus Ventrimonas merdavium]|nr:phosphoribosylanthranilate isomerase [Candidatus Ventrimonas merdavium]